jgi:hypothetical protein
VHGSSSSCGDVCPGVYAQTGGTHLTEQVNPCAELEHAQMQREYAPWEPWQPCGLCTAAVQLTALPPAAWQASWLCCSETGRTAGWQQPRMLTPHQSAVRPRWACSHPTAGSQNTWQPGKSPTLHKAGASTPRRTRVVSGLRIGGACWLGFRATHDAACRTRLRLAVLPLLGSCTRHGRHG